MSCQCTGPWKNSVPTFAELGFQCPQFKNPTDYFMKVASDTDNIPTLAQAQQRRWLESGSTKFSSRAVHDIETGEAGAGTPGSHHSLPVGVSYRPPRVFALFWFRLLPTLLLCHALFHTLPDPLPACYLSLLAWDPSGPYFGSHGAPSTSRE